MTPFGALAQDTQYLLLGLGGLVVLLVFAVIAARGRTAEAEAALAEARHLAREEAARAGADLARAVAAEREGQMRAERLDETVAGLRDQIGALRQERSVLEARLADALADAQALRVEAAALRMASQKDRAAAEREIATLRDLREEMATRFRELADETLRRQTEDASKAHHERLTALLTPFREHVGRFEEELRAVNQAAGQERVRLGEQIAALHRRSEEISVEAVNLTRALKGDKQRQGAWGEMILERILEESGLERDLHYEVQAARRDSEGRSLRPDVIVRMPRGKVVIIDSKVSLVAYEATVNAATPEERALRLREHVAALRAHVDRLGARDYAGADQAAIDYVLMFVPIEGALSEALREEGDLTSYALSKGIGLMTPTTLMVALRTIEHVWTVDRREKNAEEIARRAGLLYDKVAGFVDDLVAVGTHLSRAVGAQEDAFSKLSRGSGNVLGQVDKLRRLGARTNRTIGADFDAEGEGSTPALPDHAAE